MTVNIESTVLIQTYESRTNCPKAMQATEGIKGPVNRLSQGSRKKSSATSGLTSRGRGGG